MSRPQRRRSGWSLIELSAVIATTTMLMSVAVSLLHAVTVWSSETGSRSAALTRMEQELRDQLTQAIAIAAEGQTLSITLRGGDSAVWTLEGDRCNLHITGTQPRAEQYATGARQPWKLDVDGDITRSTLVEVRLDPAEGARGLPFRLVVARTESEETQSRETASAESDPTEKDEI